MESICLHCFVCGRVQGVFYRQSTVAQALSRGLTGWVKNLADGRVEVLICGETTAVTAMQDWLWQGPELAEVKDVVSKLEPMQEYVSFKVKN